MRKHWQQIGPYLLKHRLKIIFGVLGMIFGTGLMVVIPYVIGLAIDDIKDGLEGAIYTYPLIIAAIAFGGGLVSFIARYYIESISRHLEYDLRGDMFRHLLKLPMSYYNRSMTGDIMARLTNDLNAVRMFYGMGIMMMFRVVSLLLVAISIMLLMNVKLTLLVILVGPVITFVARKMSDRMQKGAFEIGVWMGQINAHVQENLFGTRVVRAYCQENNEIEKLKKVSMTYIDKNMALAKVESFLIPFFRSMTRVGMVITLWFGGRAALAGEISVGEFTAFLFYQMMISMPAAMFGFIIMMYQRATGSLARINEIFDEDPTIIDNENTLDIQDIGGDIEFRNLTFAYPPPPPPTASSLASLGVEEAEAEAAKPPPEPVTVLHDISFQIPRGTTTAIVGPVGCGKTTLINLIARLYEIDEDQLFIDGVDITRLPVKTLRGNIGYVPQETFLFSEKIEENIAWGVAEVDEEKVKEVAQVSQLLGNINEFGDGLKTVVGERGLTLSGGQKQRTAMSRALIMEPQILLLDDAMSSLDTHTEEEILNHLKEYMHDRTSVIVSHRISTVKDADQIIFLVDGRIVEQGTHEELLELDGMYANIYNNQQMREQLEVGLGG